MTEQYLGSPQPQNLQPATSAYMPPPPPRRGGGFFQAVLVLFAMVGFFAVIFCVGMYAIFSSFGVSDSAWLEEAHHSGNEASSQKIAIVSVDDIIMEATAEFVLDQIKAAKEDDAVKAVVLRVDSPGGTINASDHIHREVKKLCRGPGATKPVVVSMQGLAASGGYYVSAPADKIFAERTTMTGSIGVIASFPNVAELMDEWKVRMEVIKTGPLKDSGSPFRVMTDDERTRWDALIDDAFQTFIEVVVEGRTAAGLDESKVRELATGEVYIAREAKARGLVDEIGYLEDAIAAAEKLAGISDTNVIEYNRPLSLRELLIGVTAAKQSSIQIDLQSFFRANVPRLMFLSQASGFEL